MSRFEPTVSELAEREKALRASILGGTVASVPTPRVESFSASARPTPHEPSGLVAPGVPSSVLESVDTADIPNVTADAAHLIAIEFDTGKVITSFGSFDLEALELAGAANIGIQALMRNLNAVLSHLRDLHGVTAAEQAFAQLAAQQQQAPPNRGAEQSTTETSGAPARPPRPRRPRTAPQPPPIQSAAVKPPMVVVATEDALEEEPPRPSNTFDREADARQNAGEAPRRPYRPRK